MMMVLMMMMYDDADDGDDYDADGNVGDSTDDDNATYVR